MNSSRSCLSWKVWEQTLASWIVGGAMALVNSKRDLPLSSNCHCDRGEWGVRFECGDVYWLVVPCLAFQESVYLSFSRFFSFFLGFSLLSTMEIAWCAKFLLCCWSSRLKISTVPVVKFISLISVPRMMLPFLFLADWSFTLCEGSL